MNRLFEPDPRTYRHLLDRLERELVLKYRDYTTAADFVLKSAPTTAPEAEQEQLFILPEVVPAPQTETLFPVDPAA